MTAKRPEDSSYPGSRRSRATQARGRLPAAGCLACLAGCMSLLDNPAAYREDLESRLPAHLPEVLGELDPTERPVYSDVTPPEPPSPPPTGSEASGEEPAGERSAR